ncbi:MAG: 3-deoxy-manno-octulosonate cytidylyltransferase [Porphyromonadaceae bacterium]|nr:3-deoxy-manno-octulosonate cytidylyltransferase [Porphyromonadaceae bacterium]
MPHSQALIVIPARYGSSRFPGKPLVELAGKPIVQHVLERASSLGGRAVVATDDERIFDRVQSFGGEAIMTGTHHRSGTDRCLEAYRLIGRGEPYLINLQGDEPFVMPAQITTLLEALRTSGAEIATLAETFAPDTPDEELSNPNLVKLVRGSSGQALYFSRSVIPHIRGVEQGLCRHHQYYRHVGLYGFRAEVLDTLAALAPSPLEELESLEQLRWLEAGLSLQVALTEAATIGIDNPADLERAERFLRTNPNFLL